MSHYFFKYVSVARFDCICFNFSRGNVRSSSIIIYLSKCIFTAVTFLVLSFFAIFIFSFPLTHALHHRVFSLSCWFFCSVHYIQYENVFFYVSPTTSKVNYKFVCDFYFKLQSSNIFGALVWVCVRTWDCAFICITKYNKWLVKEKNYSSDRVKWRKQEFNYMRSEFYTNFITWLNTK